MAQPNFKLKKFWRELRKRTSLDDRIGSEECAIWCDEALEILRDYNGHGFRRIEGIISTETWIKYDLFVNAHQVLARKYPEGLFIADGTAGQIDKKYLLGFYDYVHNAPEKLRLFYEPAIKKGKFA